VWRVAPTGQGRATAPAWVVGQLVHAALAEWRLPGGLAPDPDFERRTEARARGYGLIDRERLQDAVRETRLLLERFRRHALFAEMDTADRRLHEIPYDLLDDPEGDGIPAHGIMDALYWRDGVWTVIDFKTDDLRGEADWDRVRRQKGYDRQADRYMVAAERLLGQRPRFKFCLLNFQGRVELRAAGQ
jgi:ATP-dependent exoDNAse (exonuclease V) beta subunit